MASMIGRRHHLILDCPDPLALATFYSELFGQPITYQSEDFVVVADSDTASGLAFQLAPDHQPPAWPDPARPQQMHFDVMVEDVTASGPRVLAPRREETPGRGGLRRPGRSSVLPDPPAGLGSPDPAWLSS